MPTKYVLDTCIYIDSLRGDEAAQALKDFLAARLGTTYLSAVVVQELRAGARTAAQIQALETGVFAPFERRHRVLVPSRNAFKEAGRILSLLALHDGVDLSRAKASLPNDALLAASCREHGMALITRDADYIRIAAHLKGFRHVAPWPGSR